MELYFLGTGEACDAAQPNTSILVKTATTETVGRILLDCGFSVPHAYFFLEPDPDELEFLWISHFHGDHFLGIPLLLLRLWEMGRRRPLSILGPPELQAHVEEAAGLGYPNLLPRLGFPLLFHELQPGERRQLNGTAWQGAYTEHSEPCLSLRLEHEGRSLFYSGDGRPTEQTLALAEGSDIVIHEAYGFEDTTPGHGSVKSCLNFARKAGISRLALVHMQYSIRLQVPAYVKKLHDTYRGITVLLPEKGSSIRL
jgi:ribonuclease BN (tRNA processing enzyme)